MTAEEISILFSPEVPLDLFSSSVIVPVYDTEKNATTGEEVEIFLPYNAVDRPWSVSPRDKLERWLYQKLSSEKYIIYIPEYKGERFSLLASREGRRFLIVLGLESEDERKVWLARENSPSYTVVVVRDREVDEDGVASISVSSLLDSFNFLSL